MAKRKRYADLTETERGEIIRLSYGNSASTLAPLFGISKSVALRVIREARGRAYSWGEREKDRGRK